ncbi:MAG: histidine phosphatase family protein [Candidatus Competibacteraceae bacterium]
MNTAVIPAWVQANRLFPLARLNLEVYLLRHGQSIANEQDRIISDLVHGGGPRFGLTALGREQVRQSVLQARERGLLLRSAWVYSSPLRRAQETAQILCEVAGIAGFTTTVALRERDFGRLNLTPAGTGYPKVWALDAVDPGHTAFGVESVLAVSERLSTFFLQLHEQVGAGSMMGRRPRVFAVLHGDPGQIAEMVFRRENPAGHRALPPLQTGEIRRLHWRTPPTAGAH